MEKRMRSNNTLDASPLPVHPYQLITGQDLEAFRQRLIIDLGQVIKEHLNLIPKKWLKSHEVRKLLKISPGTLQHLKATGVISYSKVGGVHYYDYDKIQQLLKKGNGAPSK
jgi:hypothetical protein